MYTSNLAKDRVVIITGAGKGIGRALALDLAKREPKLRFFLVSRTGSDLESLAIELSQNGAQTHALQADLARESDIEKIVSACLKAYGQIDCLVNNAGVGRFGSIEQLTTADCDYVFDINLKGTFLLTQKVFLEMAKKKSGHLVFVTSTAAEKAFEQSAIYCMSKFGQKGLVEVMRLYGYKNGIRVTNVMPGPTLTPMWGAVPPAQEKQMMSVDTVAHAIADAILLSTSACVEEIVLRPVTGDLSDSP